ncbi:hypothetical protein AS9A_2371 [Hoyosella subflava DQS3-9A1]|uniref:Uncharacterized protein n=1 Tax=Hoyosella subflava (strain DSM 45089 / JCM 17490 / NBRC 109087 / DQS3-9A1) TaxID=443218 RepID=F6ES03_HOYSD|nr:hypothetical protein AS9A_2371 [Hoyosella subflava DQS3-9A1]
MAQDREVQHIRPPVLVRPGTVSYGSWRIDRRVLALAAVVRDAVRNGTSTRAPFLVHISYYGVVILGHWIPSGDGGCYGIYQELRAVEQAGHTPQ